MSAFKLALFSLLLLGGCNREITTDSSGNIIQGTVASSGYFPMWMYSPWGGMFYHPYHYVGLYGPGGRVTYHYVTPQVYRTAVVNRPITITKTVTRSTTRSQPSTGKIVSTPKATPKAPLTAPSKPSVSRPSVSRPSGRGR